MHPKPLSRPEVEFLDTHDRLQHIPYSDMFALCGYGHLPRRFLKLKANNPPSCISCIIGKIQRRKWRTSVQSDKSIRKLGYDKPGKCTSIDQIVSAQPELVPRVSGCHTRDMITAATCFLSQIFFWLYASMYLHKSRRNLEFKNSVRKTSQCSRR